MAKFKIGDKVRILDGSKIENYTGGWMPPMERHVGEVFTISHVGKNRADEIYYILKGLTYQWDERGLELAHKFKVGDKVIGNAKANARYNTTCEGWIGTVVEILDGSNIFHDDIRVAGFGFLSNAEFAVNSECFDFYTEQDKQKIVITTDGKTTTAVLYNGKQRIKEAKAKCAPGDEFDFNYGASLALDRLTGFVRGSVESTLNTRSQMDRFIAGEIALRVPSEKMDKFLKECEKFYLHWLGGDKPTKWTPYGGWSGVIRMFHDAGALQKSWYDVKGYKYEDWKETEEDEGLLNTKICVIDGHDSPAFIAGHIYEIKDGEFSGMAYPWNSKFRNLDDLKYYFSSDDKRDELKTSNDELSHHCHYGVEFIEVTDD